MTDKKMFAKKMSIKKTSAMKMGTKKNSLWLGLLTLSVIAFFPISAFAHPGIGSTIGFGAGFSHPFGGFDHMFAMVAVGLWAAQLGGRATWAVPAAFVSLMIVGGVLGLVGVQMPYVEAGILASIVVMGVLIAAAFKLPLVVSAALVGVFAVFHGHAHGAEMSLAMSAVSYSVGFALATVLMHCAGVASGIVLQTISTERVVRTAGAAIAVGGLYMAMA